MQTEKIRVIAVVGPTSSGKTAFAVALAKALGGEVISADSRQVYRGADLMSGKATKKEMGGIPHHLLSIADPRRQYSVDRFVRDAQKAIADVVKRGNVPIVCGGTGFYVDALLQGLSLPEVPPNQKLRKTLSKKSPSQLFALLKKIDPARAKTIDRNNPARLIRAIEIAKALGKVPKRTNSTIYRTIWFGLDLPDAELKDKIRKRIDARMKAGMLSEAKRFRKMGVSAKRMHALGLEFRHLANLIEGKVTRKEFEETLARDTWRYAKRQRTWFQRNKDIRWIKPTDWRKASALSRAFLKE